MIPKESIRDILGLNDNVSLNDLADELIGNLELDKINDSIYRKCGKSLATLIEESESHNEYDGSIKNPSKTALDLLIEELNLCEKCGSKLVMIRGKYPDADNREVCPLCMADKLDTLQEIIDNLYKYARK